MGVENKVQVDTKSLEEESSEEVVQEPVPERVEESVEKHEKQPEALLGGEHDFWWPEDSTQKDEVIEQPEMKKAPVTQELKPW